MNIITKTPLSTKLVWYVCGLMAWGGLYAVCCNWGSELTIFSPIVLDFPRIGCKDRQYMTSLSTKHTQIYTHARKHKHTNTHTHTHTCTHAHKHTHSHTHTHTIL